jgi:beta-mannosidase
VGGSLLLLTLSILGAWGASTSSPVALPAGESNVTLLLTASAAQVQLWWPNGLGAQPLYNLTVTFTPSGAPGSPALTAARRTGFRVFALATGNDTDPAYVANNTATDGTDTHGMVFRVNGAAILSRGANMIPTDQMEGRYSAATHTAIVASAAAANFNTLRVWGGGVFLPDAFYDACDELGLLIYHDMQFAQSGHSPNGTSTEDAEFRHQIRRLSHHPAWVITDGCNECQVVLNTPTGIYAAFVLTVVAQEDTSRAIWPSCPSNGWTAGAARLTSLPNGSPLGLVPNTNPAAIAPRGAGPAPGMALFGDANAMGGGSLLPALQLQVGANQTCTYVNDTDVQGAGGSTAAGATPADCCPLCFASQQCTSVVWYGGQCYLKYGGSPVASPGRVMCTPQGKPQPPHTIETHGECTEPAGNPRGRGGGGGGGDLSAAHLTYPPPPRPSPPV